MKLIFYYEDSKYTIVNAKNEKNMTICKIPPPIHTQNVIQKRLWKTGRAIREITTIILYSYFLPFWYQYYFLPDFFFLVHTIPPSPQL